MEEAVCKELLVEEIAYYRNKFKIRLSIWLGDLNAHLLRAGGYKEIPSGDP